MNIMNQSQYKREEYQECNNCGTIYRFEHTCNVPSYIGEIRQRLIIIEKLLRERN